MLSLTKEKYYITYTLIILTFITFFMVICNCPNALAQDKNRGADQDTFTIGILSFSSKERTLEKWQPLAKYLSDSIPNQSFTVKPLYYTEFNDHIQDEAIDFILTNPAHYIALTEKHKISGAIATLTELSGGEAQYGFGGVIFTTNEPDAPQSLSELSGKTISAVAEDSLGGYLAAAYELKKVGIDPLHQVNFIFTGMPHCNSVHKVLSGEAQAGFVRTGVLEQMIETCEISPDTLRILNGQTIDGFDYALSTVLYPEWPFMALPHIEPHQAQLVAASLFLMEEHPGYTEDIGIHGFTIPASYLQVEMLMIALKIPPFDYETPITPLAVWEEYYLLVLLFAGIIITISFYAIHKTRMGQVLTCKNKELNAITTQLQQTNKELTEISIRDTLTGLFNRRYFHMYLSEKLSLAKKHETTLSLCVIDIDNFKQFNDTYGHNIGDLVLVQVAKALERQVQHSLDLVARYAGDEFIIILYDMPCDELNEMAKKIVTAIDQLEIKLPHDDKQVLKVSISMGITTASAHCSASCEKIFRVADQALFKAKNKGKNCYVIERCRHDLHKNNT